MTQAQSFAASFRSEVARLARKEARAIVAPAVADLAKAKRTLKEQKREVASLKRTVKHLRAALAAKATQIGSEDLAVEAKRGEKWRKDSVRSTRRRLNVTQADFAALLGVSHGSVNGWETGRTEPREAMKREVLALRGISPSEARARLDS